MKKHAAQLAAFLVIVAGAVFLALHQAPRHENEVYLSFLNGLKEEQDLGSLAFISSPGACGGRIPDAPVGPTDLLSEYEKANARGAEPVRLTQLEGKYNVVSWEDTKKVARTDGLGLLFAQSEKRIIRLSRVGFNFSRSQAVACIAYPEGAMLIHFEKIDGRWKSVNEQAAR